MTTSPNVLFLLTRRVTSLPSLRVLILILVSWLPITSLANPFDSAELGRVGRAYQMFSGGSAGDVNGWRLAAPGRVASVGSLSVGTMTEAAVTQGLLRRFWTKLSFGTMASRALAGCAAGQIAAALYNSVTAKIHASNVRYGTACAAGVIAGIAAETVSAFLIAATAPVWAATAGAVFVMGAVGVTTAALIEKFYYQDQKGRRKLVEINGRTYAKAATLNIHRDEYFVVGRVDSSKSRPGWSPLTGVFNPMDTADIGDDPVGGTQGYSEPAPTGPSPGC